MLQKFDPWQSFCHYLHNHQEFWMQNFTAISLILLHILCSFYSWVSGFQILFQFLRVTAVQTLRLCQGAFRTSPATSLHVEANEMPMELRRRRLASQYSLKISSDITNPARNCVFDKQFRKLFDKHSNQIRPLGFRVKNDFSAIGFEQKDILISAISTVPPWLLHRPSVDLSLISSAKS